MTTARDAVLKQWQEKNPGTPNPIAVASMGAWFQLVEEAGFVVAPVEPTEAMVKAAVPFKSIKGHYRAMLAAAQEFGGAAAPVEPTRKYFPMDEAPRDATTIIVPVEFEARCFWCDDLQRWVLNRPHHLEYANPKKWRPASAAAQEGKRNGR